MDDLAGATPEEPSVRVAPRLDAVAVLDDSRGQRPRQRLRDALAPEDDRVALVDALKRDASVLM